MDFSLSFLKVDYFKLSVQFMHMKSSDPEVSMAASLIFEPRYEKTGFLHMRKQRRKSASR